MPQASVSGFYVHVHLETAEGQADQWLTLDDAQKLHGELDAAIASLAQSVSQAAADAGPIEGTSAEAVEPEAVAGAEGAAQQELEPPKPKPANGRRRRRSTSTSTKPRARKEKK